MDLTHYYSSTGNTFQFNRLQASQFAKNIAGDFNPIHDQDNKRFCVPGDLLFSLVLANYGVSEKMTCHFAGMVSDQVPLNFQEDNEQEIHIFDDKEKKYLTIQRGGECSDNATLINNLIQAYVGFSGQTFPHVLVPLMKEHNVMINPARPLVIYNSMTINITDFNISKPSLSLTDSQLTVTGKRGDVRLMFNFIENDKIVGHGEKTMVLSSLREFDEEKIQALVENYNQRKNTLSE